MSEVTSVSLFPLGDAAMPRPSGPRLAFRSSAGGTLATWIHVAGELDLATAPMLADELLEARRRSRLVIIDLREVSFIDCAGLRAILEPDVARSGAILVPGRVVERLLELTGALCPVGTTGLASATPPAD